MFYDEQEMDEQIKSAHASGFWCGIMVTFIGELAWVAIYGLYQIVRMWL